MSLLAMGDQGLSCCDQSWIEGICYIMGRVHKRKVFRVGEEIVETWPKSVKELESTLQTVSRWCGLSM